jgi:hypothetical protein
VWEFIRGCLSAEVTSFIDLGPVISEAGSSTGQAGWSIPEVGWNTDQVGWSTPEAAYFAEFSSRDHSCLTRASTVCL